MAAAVDFVPPAADEPEDEPEDEPLLAVLDGAADVAVEDFDAESDVLELAPSEDEDVEEAEDSAEDAAVRESVR